MFFALALSGCVLVGRGEKDVLGNCLDFVQNTSSRVGKLLRSVICSVIGSKDASIDAKHGNHQLLLVAVGTTDVQPRAAGKFTFEN